MPGKSHNPLHVRRCVRAVAAKTGDISSAYAICVAQGQKNGTLKKGSIKATKKGKAADRRKAREPDNSEKVREYEDMLNTEKSLREVAEGLLEAIGYRDKNSGSFTYGSLNKECECGCALWQHSSKGCLECDDCERFTP